MGTASLRNQLEDCSRATFKLMKFGYSRSMKLKRHLAERMVESPAWNAKMASPRLEPLSQSIAEPRGAIAPATVRSFSSEVAERWDRFVLEQPGASLRSLDNKIVQPAARQSLKARPTSAAANLAQADALLHQAQVGLKRTRILSDRYFEETNLASIPPKTDFSRFSPVHSADPEGCLGSNWCVPREVAASIRRTSRESLKWAESGPSGVDS